MREIALTNSNQNRDGTASTLDSFNADGSLSTVRAFERRSRAWPLLTPKLLGDPEVTNPPQLQCEFDSSRTRGAVPARL
jgi:hypothetical protein